MRQKRINLPKLLAGAFDALAPQSQAGFTCCDWRFRIGRHSCSRSSCLAGYFEDASLSGGGTFGQPLQKLSPTSAQQVLDGLNGRLAAVLDGGECQHGLESTIVDLTSKPFRVLRAGPITASELSAVLGQEVLQPQVHQVAVPGNVDSHYQPKTRLRVIDDLARELATQSDELRIALLNLSALQASEQRLLKPMPQEAKAYGQALYRSLAEVDKWGVDEIWLERPPQGEAWLAVHDRLRRAAS